VSRKNNTRATRQVVVQVTGTVGGGASYPTAVGHGANTTNTDVKAICTN